MSPLFHHSPVNVSFPDDTVVVHDKCVTMYYFPTVSASMYLHGSQCHATTWKTHFLEKISIFCSPLIDKLGVNENYVST